MSKSKKSGENEQLKVLCDSFKSGISPFTPVGIPEGYHIKFTLTENVKVNNSELLSKLETFAHTFKRTKEHRGFFKTVNDNCDVYVTKNGENVELEMVTFILEGADEEEMKLLGEECKHAFRNALEVIHQANN